MASFYPGILQQGPTLLQAAPAVSGATTAQDVTITGTRGSRITLRKFVIYGTATSTFSLVIKAGATTIMDFGTQVFPTAGFIIFDVNPFTFADNVNCVISVGAASAGTTTVSYIADKN